MDNVKVLALLEMLKYLDTEKEIESRKIVVNALLLILEL
jgi:hypothetical protein